MWLSYYTHSKLFQPTYWCVNTQWNDGYNMGGDHSYLFPDYKINAKVEWPKSCGLEASQEELSAECVLMDTDLEIYTCILYKTGSVWI